MFDSSERFFAVAERIECCGSRVAPEVIQSSWQLHNRFVPVHCGSPAALPFLPYSQS